MSSHANISDPVILPDIKGDPLVLLSHTVLEVIDPWRKMMPGRGEGRDDAVAFNQRDDDMTDVEGARPSGEANVPSISLYDVVRDGLVAMGSRW